jgi:hypothetical protein
MEGVAGGALHFVLRTMSGAIARQKRWNPAKLVTTAAVAIGDRRRLHRPRSLTTVQGHWFRNRTARKLITVNSGPREALILGERRIRLRVSHD